MTSDHHVPNPSVLAAFWVSQKPKSDCEAGVTLGFRKVLKSMFIILSRKSSSSTFFPAQVVRDFVDQRLYEQVFLVQFLQVPTSDKNRGKRHFLRVLLVAGVVSCAPHIGHPAPH
eukprot:GHVU01050831.1.p1 GENE.GHVU01050831.1~~GHVU01050831.1.p1  ORF type:complete len:115 (-),score=0.96 GHVU01050831.1:41-385(-)